MKPNILLIITDHHAWFDHFGPGRTEISFPSWEKFCSEGVRFEQAFSVCPLCTPARSSMMSGIYPSRHGLRWNTECRAYGNRADFRPEMRLYSDWLTEAGYRNAYVGKWHCGSKKLPEDFGLEGWSLPHYGKIYMSDRYQEYCDQRGFGPARARIESNLNHQEWIGQTLTLHDDSPWTFMNGSGVLAGPEDAHEENFVANLSADKLKELAGSGQPWSLTASFWGPHQPYYPSEPYAGMVDPTSIPVYPTFDDDLKGRPLRHFLHRDMAHNQPRKQWPEWSDWQPIMARAYEQQLQTDAAIGRILTALDESGQADNTLVIWLADHGDALASHGGIFDKRCTMTEEVMRIPMAVRLPGRSAAGKVSRHLVSNMDVTATMLAAAGLDVPQEMDSRNVLPLCEDPESAHWHDQLVCEHSGHSRNVMMRALYTDRYKYVAAIFEDDEFYDLETDPNETNNLLDSAEHADVAREMRGRLIGHLEARCTGKEEQLLLYALRHQQ